MNGDPKPYARGQTDEGDSHREADHTEHVRDLDIVARPQHRNSKTRLVSQDSVENHDDHYAHQNIISCLRSERDRSHRAEKNERVDEHTENQCPEKRAFTVGEVHKIPGKSRQHLVESNLIGCTNTDQSYDKRKV